MVAPRTMDARDLEACATLWDDRGPPPSSHDVKLSVASLTRLGCGVYGHLRLSIFSPHGEGPAIIVPVRAVPCPKLSETQVAITEPLFRLLGQHRIVRLSGASLSCKAAPFIFDTGLSRVCIPRPEGHNAAYIGTRPHAHDVSAVARAMRGLQVSEGFVYVVRHLGVVWYYRATRVVGGEGQLGTIPMVQEVDLEAFQPLGGDTEEQEPQVEGLETEAFREFRDLVLSSLGMLSSSSTEAAGEVPPMQDGLLGLRIRGVLLCGPCGSGKTWMVRRVLSELARSRHPVWARYYAAGVDILGRIEGMLTGQGEADGRASAAARLVVVDDVDGVVPEDEEEDGSDAEAWRVMWQLRRELHEACTSGARVCLVLVHREEAGGEARTKRLLSLRGALYDRMVEVPPLSQDERCHLLSFLLRAVPFGPGVKRAAVLDRLAQSTSGFVASDLTKLCERALQLAFRRASSQRVGLPPDHPAPPCHVAWEDLQHARSDLRPSSLRGLDVVGPDATLTWASFGGYEDVKARLQQLIHWPLQHAASFARLGLRSVPGIVLHGPSGCGKSMLARVIAAQARASFVAVQATDIFSMYLGESEARLRAIFARARKALPCIVFLDELDAIAIKRDGGDTVDAVGSVYARVLSTLLNEMDGMEGRAEGLLILAATCRIDAIDAALLRPGRLQEAIQLRLPDPRRDFLPILTVACEGIPLAEHVDLQRLVDDVLLPIVGVSQGGGGAGEVTVTAADLRAFCREAAMEALRENIHGSTVQWTHFEKAQRKLWPQIRI